MFDQSKIIEIIAEQLGVSKAAVTEEALFEDLGADSLDLFQVVSALEEEFNMEFDSEDAEKLKTVGDAVEYMKAMME